MNAALKLRKLEALEIDPGCIGLLPEDPIQKNYCRQVPQACYSRVSPKSFPRAQLIAFSPELALTLGLDPAECRSERFVQVFSGNRLLSSMIPYASCYGGHQFGNWAGQLGDGRAINLGDVKTPAGQHWTLQLKGAGATPYARTADGLAVLRSSIREFLCSEAMHHLGAPTTRALCLIGSGETVVRDMFYDGHPKREPGAIVCRAAPSFTRFGSFEIFAARGELDILKQLADYTIRRHFPQLGEPGVEAYQEWFREVCRATADMIIHWARVGFVHGVMNTDNMSILGLTIDYGPYGWLENYDPNWTPNTTDAEGRRYRFGQQARIALWNLVQLGNAIYPLVESAKPLEDALHDFQNYYERRWLEMMAAKIGLEELAPGDEKLLHDLLKTFSHAETDMTLFFRHLANLDSGQKSKDDDLALLLKVVKEAFYSAELEAEAGAAFVQWLARYRARLQEEQRPQRLRRERMNAVNPLYVLRNYLAQLAIDESEQGNHKLVHELLEALKTPYQHQEGKAHLAAKRPEWARHRAGCSMLSCSS